MRFKPYLEIINLPMGANRSDEAESTCPTSIWEGFKPAIKTIKMVQLFRTLDWSKKSLCYLAQHSAK